MVSLGLSGIVLFAVSVAALAAPDSYQTSFFDTTWRRLGSRDKQVSIIMTNLWVYSLLPFDPSLSLPYPSHLPSSS